VIKGLDYYLFTDIPGSGKDWQLAVRATSLKDAREYVKARHTRGRYLGIHTPSRSDYDTMICGAVTDNAQAIISGGAR